MYVKELLKISITFINLLMNKHKNYIGKNYVFLSKSA